MARQISPRRTPLQGIERVGRNQGQLWAIVLAGGEGVRLRPLIRRVFGDERPKQYAALLESRSLVRQTLDRVALSIPPERTTVVTHRKHVAYIAAEFGEALCPKVLIQPVDRGTAAGVLFPGHWISWRDPDAIVAVFPSDHFVLGEAAFMNRVMEVAAFVRRHPQWLVLLGARPTEPETEYGWIELGDPVSHLSSEPVCKVRGFCEKPPEEVALRCFSSGCVWNTFVFISHVATLIEVARQFLPTLSGRLARIAPFSGTEAESWAIAQAYAFAPSANFSRGILEHCPPFLAATRLPALMWSDLGTPARVVKTMRAAGMSPPWLAEVENSA